MGGGSGAVLLILTLHPGECRQDTTIHAIRVSPTILTATEIFHCSLPPPSVRPNMQYPLTKDLVQSLSNLQC